MSTSGARSVGGTGTGTGTHRDDTHTHGRTPAQWFCLIVGVVLVLVGLLGFLADATFDTGLSGTDNDGGNRGGALQGDSFLGFEVNGWGNIVHLLTGGLLLSAFAKRKSAKTIALVFGVVYLLVTIIGLIDGNDVLGLFPVNGPDNVLHLLLGLGAIGAALASRADGDRRGEKF